ncbi:hypothetical protein ACJQWK_05677 [Exserohilum turcicum]
MDGNWQMKRFSKAAPFRRGLQRHHPSTYLHTTYTVSRWAQRLPGHTGSTLAIMFRMSAPIGLLCRRPLWLPPRPPSMHVFCLLKLISVCIFPSCYARAMSKLLLLQQLWPFYSLLLACPATPPPPESMPIMAAVRGTFATRSHHTTLFQASRA